MSLVPDNDIGKVRFYESHIGPWTVGANAIGLDPESVAELENLTMQARAAYSAALAARQAAKAATAAFHNAVRAMHAGPNAGSDLIDRVRNFAESTDNRAVYTIAQIPPRATPGTLPPPGTPSRFAVELRAGGSLELRWRCANPRGTQGTIYEILRCDHSAPLACTSAAASALAAPLTATLAPHSSGDGPLVPEGFVFVGARGVRRFIDDTLPAGVPSVTYQVTAVRSTTRGRPARFTVNFGVQTWSGTERRLVAAPAIGPAAKKSA